MKRLVLLIGLAIISCKSLQTASPQQTLTYNYRTVPNGPCFNSNHQHIGYDYYTLFSTSWLYDPWIRNNWQWNYGYWGAWDPYSNWEPRQFAPPATHPNNPTPVNPSIPIKIPDDIYMNTPSTTSGNTTVIDIVIDKLEKRGIKTNVIDDQYSATNQRSRIQTESNSNGGRSRSREIVPSQPTRFVEPTFTQPRQIRGGSRSSGVQQTINRSSSTKQGRSSGRRQ